MADVLESGGGGRLGRVVRCPGSVGDNANLGGKGCADGQPKCSGQD